MRKVVFSKYSRKQLAPSVSSKNYYEILSKVSNGRIPIQVKISDSAMKIPTDYIQHKSSFRILDKRYHHPRSSGGLSNIRSLEIQNILKNSRRLSALRVENQQKTFLTKYRKQFNVRHHAEYLQINRSVSNLVNPVLRNIKPLTDR